MTSSFEVLPNGNHALVETETGLNSEMLRSDTWARGLFPLVASGCARAGSRGLDDERHAPTGPRGTISPWRDDTQRALDESRREAALLVFGVIALQAALAAVSWAGGWKLWVFPGWVWALVVVPELLLFAALTLPASHRRLAQSDRRRQVAHHARGGRDAGDCSSRWSRWSPHW